MVRGSIGVRRLALTALAGAFVLSLSGCPSDPYDPDTWIEKLDNPEEVERAVQELDRLGDPKAIEPLGKTWEKHNRWSRVLRVIINLADQSCPPGKEDCSETEKNGPYWDDAIPILKKALSDFDVSDKRSIEDAVVAADALGQAQKPETVQTLVNAAMKKMPKLSPGQRVRIAAVRALGKFGSNSQAVKTLIKVLEMDPEQQPLQVNAAAANALAETGSEKAIQPLLIALYEISPIYKQVRAALTRVGKPAVPELLKIFKGEHKALNEFAKENGFAQNCEEEMGPDTSCKAPGNLKFKSALLLGDLRAQEAVPVLVRALKSEPKVSFFDNRTGAPGPTHHNSVLNALKLIGDPKTADEVGAYMKADSTLDQIRPLAIDTYSWLTSDPGEMGWLAKQIKDDGQEEQIRKASALTYARLVYDEKQLAPLDFMIKRYRKEAKKWEAKAEKADEEAKKKQFEGKANGYWDLVREFEQHKVRALVGVECGTDPECHAKKLDLKDSEAIDMIGLSKEEKEELGRRTKKAYRVAAVERSLFELMKAGKEAKSVLPKLLAKADATEGFVREGLLSALVKVAGQKCEECEKRLAEVIEAQKDQTTLDRLTTQTRVVLNYFKSAR